MPDLTEPCHEPGQHTDECVDIEEGEQIDVTGQIQPHAMTVQVDVSGIRFLVMVPRDNFESLEFAVAAFPEAFRQILEAAADGE